jgi:hypothetical protein
MNWPDFMFGFISGAFALLVTMSIAAWRTMKPLIKAQQSRPTWPTPTKK